MASKRQRLAQQRRAAGLTQEQLAELLGVERSTITRWESAETEPQPWQRPKLARALGVSLAELEELLANVVLGATNAKHRTREAGTTPLHPNLAAVHDGLGSALTAYTTVSTPTTKGRPLAAVEAGAVAVHEAYQRADYGEAAQLLPAVLGDAEASALEAPGRQRRRAHRAQAVAYIAAAKLASKAGDGQLAWLAADRAAVAARLADAPELSAMATYQVACAYLSLPDMLLAALVAARRGDAQAARECLAEAATVAERLGRDDNRLWTAFGPTNVVIHEVSVAVALGQLDKATRIGEVLDTSRLPQPLLGRRTQVHLDLATACAHRAGGDPYAVLHLIEAERIAPQVVRVNMAARNLLVELLERERQAITPGLRPLARRAGVLA
jgi:transcriptional regulator with XRE-family HTH domain